MIVANIFSTLAPHVLLLMLFSQQPHEECYHYPIPQMRELRLSQGHKYLVYPEYSVH